MSLDANILMMPIHSGQHWNPLIHDTCSISIKKAWLQYFYTKVTASRLKWLGPKSHHAVPSGCGNKDKCGNPPPCFNKLPMTVAHLTRFTQPHVYMYVFCPYVISSLYCLLKELQMRILKKIATFSHAILHTTLHLREMN
jgi:hypothetical protein